jgi:hypothetical protein
LLPFCRGFAGRAFGESGGVGGELIDIGIRRIEVVRDPFGDLGVALVLGIVDRVEEFGVAPGAADVLGRTSSDDLEQLRIKNAGNRGRGFFRWTSSDGLGQEGE